MRAVVLYEYGPAENLRYEETGDPKYGDDEVLVRVKATSITPSITSCAADRLRRVFR